MTVTVGELTSQVDVQGAPGAAAPGGPSAGGGSLQPTWTEREKHDRLATQHERDRCRVAGDGFDG
jgi:hypothetical protein